MTFHERIEIAKEYKIWAENNKVKDCPESVMAFLTIKGLLANSFHCVDAISRQAVLEVIRKCHCEEWVKAEIGAPIEALSSVTPAEKQEICEDYISRSSIKQKLQEHHDFFVNAYGGFSNLPQNDKSRVDEITNCIAMVVNEPSVTPAEKVGQWKPYDGSWYECSECGAIREAVGYFENFCFNCGAKMQEVEE